MYNIKGNTCSLKYNILTITWEITGFMYTVITISNVSGVLYIKFILTITDVDNPFSLHLIVLII